MLRKGPKQEEAAQKFVVERQLLGKLAEAEQEGQTGKAEENKERDLRWYHKAVLYAVRLLMNTTLSAGQPLLLMN